MKPSNIKPKLIILVVYKTNEGHWRGFCSPYDITCERLTKKATKEALEESVELYKEGLEKYNYPRHLSIKQLSNPQDEAVLKMALKIIAEMEKENLLNNYDKYQEEELNYIKNRDHNLSGYYYHQSAYAV